jgi:surface protein
MATAYALILNNGNNTYSMSFVKSDTTINVGDTYNSTAYGALPVVAVYTGFETDDYTAAAAAPWSASYRTKITSVTVESEIKPLSMAYWFAQFEKCTSIDVSLVNTENTTSMRALFDRCFVLSNLVGIGDWDTGAVTTMQAMFQGCYELTAIDVAEWDISSVTSIVGMFYSCNKLTTLDVSKWQTGSVIDMTKTFCNCTALTTLDVSNWNVGSVESFELLFCGCSKINSLDVSTWDTSSVTSMFGTFDKCTSLTSLDVSNWDVSNVTTFKAMFQGNNHVGDMKLAQLDVSKWDTSSATEMNWMFYGCGQLTELDLSNWDVSNVTSMYHMFADCKKLENINFGTWESGKCKDFDGMFNDCHALTTLNLSTFDWSSLEGTGIAQMFENCISLKTITGLERIDTSRVTSLQELFSNCSSLESLNIASWDVSKVDYGSKTFYNCSKLQTLDLSGWDISSCTVFTDMLQGLTSLKMLKVGNKFIFDGNEVTEPLVMPAPAVSGNDGHWYDADGNQYAPEDIPSGTANTYYAAINLIDITYAIKKGTLIGIANAVREKTGSTEKMTPNEIINEIHNISVGDGVNITFQNFSVIDDGNGNITITQ